MKNIKLIALDLDGTLLDSQKRLSYKNESILKECIQKGIWIVPCTGRSWNGMPVFLQNFPGVRYAITTNGALIEDVMEHKVLAEHRMDCELAMDILRLARQFHTMYDVYVGGDAFGESRFADCMDEYGIEPSIQEMFCKTRRFVPDVCEQIRKLGKPVEKINYFFGDMKERTKAKAVLESRQDIVVTSSLTNNLEINAIGATKGDAILHLSEILGIRPEETMGIGDGSNDVTMIQMAGIGVAMGNAEEKLKKMADYVTGTNDEDGVAAAIERFVWGR